MSRSILNPINECRITLITEEGNADGEALIFMTGSRVTRVNVGGFVNGRNFAGIFRSR